MDFSIDITELRNDMLTIQRYSNELIAALNNSGLNTVKIVNFETMINSAISQLKYFKEVNAVLSSDKDSNLRRINELLERNRQLEVINSNNTIVTKSINSLSDVYNTQDLEELIDKIKNEHNLLQILKNKVATLPEISKLYDEISTLKTQLAQEKAKNDKNRHQQPIMYVATAATGAGVTFLLNKIFTNNSSNK